MRAIVGDLRKVLAFVLKEVRTMMSYRLAFITSLIYPLIGIVLFIFFASIFRKMVSAGLIPYGGDYLAFALIGMIMWQFVALGLYSISDKFRAEMEIGTLETIFLTPSNPLLLLIGTVMISLVISLFFSGFALLIGVLLFGIKIHTANYIIAFAILLLTFFSMLGFGMEFAGITLITKSAGEIITIFVTLMMFLCGVYFPVSMLPELGQRIAYAIPLTHALDSLRQIVLAGAGWEVVAPSFWMLLILTLITLPVGYMTFSLCLKKARQDGSLVQY
jgi:ABC-2 type transport system permease protein